jgi:V/A-type H+-transporting ATPase subunit G/H
MAESKITGIIDSLNILENDLDMLNGKISDIKKQLSLRTIAEIDKLYANTREMALKEAQVFINKSKEKASLESTKIAKEGEAKLSEIKSIIDARFNEAVEHVVSTVLKA